MEAFLFRLGYYEGEPITVISKKKNNCIVSIKNERYNIDRQEPRERPRLERVPRGPGRARIARAVRHRHRGPAAPAREQRHQEGVRQAPHLPGQLLQGRAARLRQGPQGELRLSRLPEEHLRQR